MSTTAPDTVKAVKHRACDECRTRKLACSKDPDGCERCRRENIVCHYSSQKPMGRPRKRQFIETTREDSVTKQNVDPLDLAPPLPFVVDEFDDYNDPVAAEPYFTNGLSQPSGPIVDGQGAAVDDGRDGRDGRAVWHFGDRDLLGGPPINFGEINFGSSGNAPSSVASVPQLSTGSNTSTSDSGNSPPQVATGPCSCLASMYLALASLQQFPTDIVPALKTVRDAAATAATSIWCPQCGTVALEMPNPPIEGFQNTMLLGTILPIIANGYQKLLKMVDQETDAAVAGGQTKTFRFHDYGGFCGRQENIPAAMTCIEKDMFFNEVEMPPQQWRNTVRALLRVDIYGHEQPDFNFKGLKDLVSEMEFRQRTRHELLDAQVAAGTMTYGHFGQKLCLGEQTHGCLQILKMAKVAIDSLVIA